MKRINTKQYFIEVYSIKKAVSTQKVEEYYAYTTPKPHNFNH